MLPVTIIKTIIKVNYIFMHVPKNYSKFQNLSSLTCIVHVTSKYGQSM